MIIAGPHAEFGLAHGNYEEFRFFTGLRQAEQIALTIRDCDLEAGKIYRKKTGIDREITPCGIGANPVLQLDRLFRDDDSSDLYQPPITDELVCLKQEVLEALTAYFAAQGGAR